MENELVVKNFISEFWNVNLSQINEDMCLSDFGMFGADKEDFFLSFFETFKIDSSDFDWNKYVEPESNTFFMTIRGIIDLIRGKRQKNTDNEVFVKDLVLALKNKKWIDKVSYN